MAPVAADWTTKVTGMVSPIRAVGGSSVTKAPPAAIAAKVALLERMVSEGLFRYDARLIMVLTPAGTVTAVTRGVIETAEVGPAVEVAGAVEEEPPITVTRTSTV